MSVRRRQSRPRALLLILVGASPCASAFSSFPAARSLPRPPASGTENNGWGARRTSSFPSSNKRHVSSDRGASSSPSALMATMIPQLAGRVTNFYKTFPLVAGFLTASTKGAFADSIAQYRDVCTTKFDVRRNLAMMLYSGLLLGVMVEVMYNRALPILFGTAVKSGARAVKMTLFDGFVNAPLLWLPPAYIAQAVVYRYPKREAILKYVKDVRENGLLKKYWSLWLPVSMINFMFVPDHFRVLFVATVSFFWLIILSLVANTEQVAESCPSEPEPKMLNPRALD